MYFDTSLKRLEENSPTYRVPVSCHVMGQNGTGILLERCEEEMEGSDGTCEDTADTTMLVQIEETKCVIRKLSFETVLAPVRAVGGKG